MKSFLPKILALFLAAFGLLTLFLSTSLIFDLFNVREGQGNFVLFIVWTNFVCSLLYLIAAYGFFSAKKWTASILGIAALMLLVSFIGLLIYINSGGIHESKTISAMIFRLVVTLAFAFLAYVLVSKRKV